MTTSTMLRWYHNCRLTTNMETFLLYFTTADNNEVPGVHSYDYVMAANEKDARKELRRRHGRIRAIITGNAND